jgi:hypothetical protein
LETMLNCVIFLNTLYNHDKFFTKKDRCQQILTRRLGGGLLLLLTLLGATNALAALPARNVSPILRPSPPLAQPAAPQTSPVPGRKIREIPAQAGPSSDAAATEAAVRTLLEKGVFTPDLLSQHQNTPLTRAEWAGILVRALKHNTRLFSAFPFYRDVPADHPDYVPIEVAREKKLLAYPADHGFYYPEKPIAYADVYQGISHALTGPFPAPETEAHLLKGFGDRAELSPDLAAAVAKMARVHFFTAEAGRAETRVHANDAVTPDGLAPLMVYLMRVIERRADLSRREIAEVPALPGGLTLALSPSTAVMETQLTPGQIVTFSLVNVVPPLTKESRIRAVVRDVDSIQHRYGLIAEEARTPEDDFYRLRAPLTLLFPPRRRTPFIVPGQLFEATTETVTDRMDGESSLPTPVPAP